MAGVGGRWHDGANEDGGEDTGEDEDEADVIDRRQAAVGEHDGQSAGPGHDDIDDENVPAFGHVVWVEEVVHCQDLVGEDERHGGGAEDPGEEVPPPREPA